MSDTQYDLIVVGAGPGGYPAAIRAAQRGLKTAIVERDALGGICLNWGCIPTKALLKTADLYDHVKKAADYGIQAGEPSLEWPRVIQRSRQVADRLSKGVQSLMKKHRIDVLYGNGVIEKRNRVVVTNSQRQATAYTAKYIVIATGGRPRQLPGIEFDGRLVISSKEAMVLTERPNSIAIIGAGAIGVEFASFYGSMGSKVTLIEALSQILPMEDPEIAGTVHKSLEKRNVDIFIGAKVERVLPADGIVTLSIQPSSGETVSVKADRLLVAAGVSGNIENIGLEALGVTMEKGFIVADRTTYATNIPGIFAIGDVIGPPLLAHVATKEAIVCVDHITGHTQSYVNYDNVPGCTYCSPQVASVGFTESKAKEKYPDLVRVGRFPFRASGRALASGEHDGLVKFIIHAQTGEILGVHMVGAEVTELLSEVIMAREMELTVHELHSLMHAHPTLAEAVMEAAADALGEAIHI